LQQKSSTILTGFPNRLKRLREHLNLNQNELAERVDVSRGTLQNWEVGRAEPRNNVVWERLAEQFGCSVVFLQHGLAKIEADRALAKAQEGYTDIEQSLTLRESASPFGAEEECKAHVKAYIEAAKKIPNGLIIARHNIRRKLPLSDFEMTEDDALSHYNLSRQPSANIAAGHAQDSPPIFVPQPRKKRPTPKSP
jgi:DNA-binding XRE family transcriptional regulator